eukprot:CAMPEP_0119313646 /NCGR_PEP_ID=MMETSP1333-20130426/29826_1 /TAXON_ID=418940 /ORGANISM="Scyphosphaera apsteinii, Strain RCC1455" /LENGTH=907 /DNA_ID=CAMNT_0007318519 /DNA_START=113 /DNA_END=2836 /DNA_ORIENTATION=-
MIRFCTLLCTCVQTVLGRASIGLQSEQSQRSAVLGESVAAIQQGSQKRIHSQQRLSPLRGGSMGMGTRGLDPSADMLHTREPLELDDDEPEEPEHPQQQMPHALLVDTPESPPDSSECVLHPVKAQALGLMAGDTVRLKGKRNHETLCTLRENDQVPESSAWLTAETRRNLHLKVGDTAKVYACDTVKFGKTITLQPLTAQPGVTDALAGLTSQELLEQLVQPHFMSVDSEGNAPYRPTHEGDRILIRHGAQDVEFKVVEIEVLHRNGDESEAAKYCIVEPETNLVVLEELLDRALDDSEDSIDGYDAIGGVDKQLSKIRELVELPMRHPKVFTRVGVRPPRGVLIHGPPGCGKTMIVKAVAAETGAFFQEINGPAIMAKQSGDSEADLRKAFEEAEERAPSIIFIDEIDAIAPRRDKTQGDAERRIVSQLLTLMDGLKPKSQVVLMAATNRPNVLEPALRRFGRFDLEINIPVPDEPGRLDILRIKSRDLRLSSEVDLIALAADTQGYCGADLAQTIFEAAMLCVREVMPQLDLEAERLPKGLIDSLLITPEHIHKALQVTNPSTLRETAIEVPNVSWQDIGGLEDVKRELRETVQYPVQYADKFEYFGMSPSKGVLFYGPPGCGKTLLAKAIANECKANFISVKGPELLTMWFGESEANVRDLFDKARQASPCVVFFDEMDSIAKARGSGGGGASEAGDRVINQILTEIDGVGARKSVFVIGATNRPDILDPAVMRPGRLDQLIYIPVPDHDSRLSIFRANLRKSPLAEDVDLNYLANITADFSGADITEICQRACKLAIRQEIAEQQKAEEEAGARGLQPPELKANGKLCAKHFDEAMKTARKSVSKKELARYLEFREKLALSGGTPARAVAEAASASDGAGSAADVANSAAAADELDDDELYG